jgi:hypothetical protein
MGTAVMQQSTTGSDGTGLKGKSMGLKMPMPESIVQQIFCSTSVLFILTLKF